MGPLVAAVIALALSIWLLFFTELTILQVGLIFAIAVVDFIGDRLK